MKYVVPSLVVVLIFVLPAISYLYLRNGFIYRKDALEELKNEIPFDESQIASFKHMDSTLYQSVQSDVHYFLDVRSEEDKEDLLFIAESFKARKDFIIHGMFDEKETKSRDTSFQSTLKRHYYNKDEFQFFPDSVHIILASNGKIRNQYGFSSEDFNRAYEHAVILLPMKKREKIKLIRDEEI